MSDQGSSSIDLRSVLVVDDDEVSRNMVANFLGRMGIPNVTMCENGDDAWHRLCTKKFDMIVLDWKLPGVSGLALFNRIRRRTEYRMVPLLVVSGMLERNDFRLLQEFPCSALLEKPFAMGKFQQITEELVRENSWYAQNAALVDTLLEAVGGDGRKAEQLLKQVLKQSPRPMPLALVAARQLTAKRLLKSAKAVLESVLKIDPESIIAMNEYGKVMHLLGRHKEGLAMLRQATKLSPQNVQRLCLMGEAELNLKDPESAKANFAKALEIDVDDHKASSGLVVANNMESWLDHNEGSDVPRSFASILNTMGIALVRSGEFERGVEQYRSALAFLHAHEDAARVAFNLGLGYMRWGRPEDALPWFRRSEALAPEGFGKAASYVHQLVINGAGGIDQHLLEADFSTSPNPQAGTAATGNAARADPTRPSAVEDDDPQSEGNVIPFPFGHGAPGGDDAGAEASGGKHEEQKRNESAAAALVNFEGFGADDVSLNEEEEQAVL